MNGRLPGEPLSPWLQPPPEPLLNRMNHVNHEPPDIYAIGFQELDLSVEAFLFNDSCMDEKWMQHIEKVQFYFIIIEGSVFISILAIFILPLCLSFAKSQRFSEVYTHFLKAARLKSQL